MSEAIRGHMREYNQIYQETIEYREDNVSNHRLDALMTVLHYNDRFLDIRIDVDVRDLLDEQKKGHYEIPAIIYTVRLVFGDYRQYQAFIVQFIEELDKRKAETKEKQEDNGDSC
jgi:hypothetical protein